MVVTVSYGVYFQAQTNFIKKIYTYVTQPTLFILAFVDNSSLILLFQAVTLSEYAVLVIAIVEEIFIVQEIFLYIQRKT